MFLLIKTHATVIYVDSANTNAFQDGSSWTAALTDLQLAINTAYFGDSIWVAKGTYQPINNATFSMKNGVKMLGGFLNTDTNITQRNWLNNISKLKGIGGYMVIYNNNATISTATLLDGFIVANGGSGIGEGGGIFNQYSSPTISNCMFTENQSMEGGGAIFNSYSSPIITNCIFSNNHSNIYGGAICNQNSSISITHCSFINNYDHNYGGAIYNESSNIVLDSCDFINNNSFSGGALYSSITNYVSFTGCNFTNNAASISGGAIYFITSTGKMDHCNFTGNTSDTFYNFNGGGAIYTFLNGSIGGPNPALYIDHCNFSGNHAKDSRGGAICNQGGGADNDLVISNCSMVEDSAKIGGAIYTINSAPIIINSIISKNFSDSIGGAVYNDSAAKSKFINCTIVGNRALVNGSTMYNCEAQPTINNCILWGNYDGIFNDTSSQIIATYNLMQGYSNDATNHIIGGTTDPNFVDTSNNYHLLSSSPCIDAGSNSFIQSNINTDIEGNARIIGSSVDLGAYESTFNIVGIHSVFFEENKISLSPNPAKETIVIKTVPSLLPSIATITDLSGKILKTLSIKQEREFISLTGLLQGVYVFNISSRQLAITFIKD